MGKEILLISCRLFSPLIILAMMGEVILLIHCSDPTYRPEGDMKKCVDELFIDDMN